MISCIVCITLLMASNGASEPENYPPKHAPGSNGCMQPKE